MKQVNSDETACACCQLSPCGLYQVCLQDYGQTRGGRWNYCKQELQRYRLSLTPTQQLVGKAMQARQHVCWPLVELKRKPTHCSIRHTPRDSRCNIIHLRSELSHNICRHVWSGAQSRQSPLAAASA